MSYSVQDIYHSDKLASSIVDLVMESGLPKQLQDRALNKAAKRIGQIRKGKK